MFVVADPPEGSLSSLYLPYPATTLHRPTLSIATPPNRPSPCLFVLLSTCQTTLPSSLPCASHHPIPTPRRDRAPSSSFSFASVLFQPCFLNPLFSLFFFFFVSFREMERKREWLISAMIIFIIHPIIRSRHRHPDSDGKKGCRVRGGGARLYAWEGGREGGGCPYKRRDTRRVESFDATL